MTGRTNSKSARSYTPKMLAASPNDKAYFERREDLYLALEALGPCVVTPDLVERLGWDRREITAKLMSLRTDGLVTYEGGVWEPDCE